MASPLYTNATTQASDKAWWANTPTRKAMKVRRATRHNGEGLLVASFPTPPCHCEPRCSPFSGCDPSHRAHEKAPSTPQEKAERAERKVKHVGATATINHVPQPLPAPTMPVQNGWITPAPATPTQGDTYPMKQAEVKVGETYWTNIGNALAAVVVLSSFEDYEGKLRFRVRRLEDTKPLTNARSAAALRQENRKRF